MSIIKIQGGLSGGNKGSSKQSVSYLEKEGKIRDKSLRKDEPFFNQKEFNITGVEAVKKLDKKRGGISKTTAKYFSILIAPSEKELVNLSDQDLKNCAIEAMEVYAQNFEQEVNSNELVWYAKLEHHRKYKGLKKKKKDKLNTPLGAKSGQYKSGDNRHIHILVRRKTDDNVSASPFMNARKSRSTPEFGGGKIGFNQISFSSKCEAQMHNYIRSKKPEYKVYEEDTQVGNFLKENNYDYQRASFLGMNERHIAMCKKRKEEEDIKKEKARTTDVLRTVKEIKTKKTHSSTSRIQTAVEFHLKEKYKGKINNISYQKEGSPLIFAVQLKYGYKLTLEELKVVHSKVLEITKSMKKGYNI